MKIAIIFGTRPEIIKLSPVIRECQARNLNFMLIHTNQHYSPEMDAVFLYELHIPNPQYNLNVGSGTHGAQTGKMLQRIEKILLRTKPDTILIQGDTNTVLAAALAAKKLHIKIGHIEAGLRSFSTDMPEETNRILTDHCSDWLFAPTSQAKKSLIREGISSSKIFLTGNTIADAIRQNLSLARRHSKILSQLQLHKNQYLLATFHRPENVDNRHNLNNILTALYNISQAFAWPIICPIHPRTLKEIKRLNQALLAGIVIIPPLGYLDFLSLEYNAKLVLTDSGGVQEETCILKTPCVTLRNNTERPETILVGSNILVGTNPGKIRHGVNIMLRHKKTWKNPFGTGRAAEAIVDAIAS